MNGRRNRLAAARRPSEMRIEEARCTECGACFDLAPVIVSDPQHIPISPITLDAMAECPTGAIVWREAGRVNGEADG